MNAPFRKIMLVLSAAFLLAGAARAEIMQPPGSRVVIDVPAGFELADGFTGMVREDGSSFVIAEVPASAFEEIKRTFSAADLTKVRLNNAKSLKLDRSDDYYALEGVSDISGVPVTRFLLLFHDDKNTAMVTVNLPTESLTSGEIKREDIMRALAGTALRERKEEEKSFTLGYTGALKYAGTFAGFSTIYNLQGKLAEKPIESPEPALIVTIIPDTLQEIDDIRSYGERSLRAEAVRGEIQMGEIRPITIGALKGWSFTAITELPYGADRRKEKVYSYNVGLTYDDGIVWLQARAPLKGLDKWISEFPKMMESFALKQNKAEAGK